MADASGCDLCQYLPKANRCQANWQRPNLPPVEQVMRFWLAHGINPGLGGYHGHHAQALADLLAPEPKP